MANPAAASSLSIRCSFTLHTTHHFFDAPVRWSFGDKRGQRSHTTFNSKPSVSFKQGIRVCPPVYRIPGTGDLVAGLEQRGGE